MNKWVLLFILVLAVYSLLLSSEVNSEGVCKKCVDRDFTLYTVGYEFNSGDEIIVRLQNIGDKDAEIGHLELYIVFPGNESIYIGRFEINSVIRVGSYYEFRIGAPKVEKEESCHLVAFLDIGDKVVSNDFIIKPLDTFKTYLNVADSVLTLIAIVLIGYIAYKYYYKV